MYLPFLVYAMISNFLWGSKENLPPCALSYFQLNYCFNER